MKGLKLTWENVEEEKKVCVCVRVFTHFCMFGCTVCVCKCARDRERRERGKRCERERERERKRERGGRRGERGYIRELKGSMAMGNQAQ